jgi:hypothetical protein
MGNPQVKLNKDEVRRLLRGEGPYSGVKSELQRRIERIREAAGPGHSTEVSVTQNRLRAAIWTTTDKAREAEAQDLNLTRAIDAGRAET